MDPGTLAAVFKQSLTAGLLAGMLRSALPAAVPGGPSWPLALISGLPNVPRFDMALMCLPGKEKTALKGLWDAALERASGMGSGSGSGVGSVEGSGGSLADGLRAARGKYKM